MEYCVSLAFCGSTSVLNFTYDLVEDGTLEEYASPLDALDTEDIADNFLIYRIESENCVNIYEIQKLIMKADSHNEYFKNDESIDVIYAITDTKTFVDVISISGDYDTHIDSDVEKIADICKLYGLEFYIEDDPDDYNDDEDEDDNYYY